MKKVCLLVIFLLSTINFTFADEYALEKLEKEKSLKHDEN